MPCYEPSEHEMLVNDATAYRRAPDMLTRARAISDTALMIIDEENLLQATHNSIPAELLCELFKKNGIKKTALTPRLRNWWEQHLERDKRKNRSQLKRDKQISKILAQKNPLKDK